MDFAERARELVARMTLPEKLSQMRYDAPGIPRLGVPAYSWWNECLHGVARSGRATVFPQAIAMAATFDDGLVERTAETISVEARAKFNMYRRGGEGTGKYQGLSFFTPNINIFRDPRWGRGQETYGEDPCLTGRMGAAFVRGLQGSGKYHRADATVKHYAVHSGPERGRHSFDARPSEKDLYETYLAAFRYCVEHARPASVMGAYNRVNGEPCCGSPRLLETILRGEFGFDGFVVSDCGAVCDFHEHHGVTANAAESAALAVKSGCDLNCGTAYQWLKTSVAMGLLDEATVTRSVERLFEARFRLGLFDDDCEYDAIGMEEVESPGHVALSRRVAAEGIVLLKNDGVLPLSPKARVAVIGPNADDRTVLTANYAGTPTESVTVLQGIREIAAETIYAPGGHHFIDADRNDASDPTREALDAARRADVVVMVMGLNPSMEGEEGDARNSGLNGDRAEIELPACQQKLFEDVLAAGKPVVFVNVSGSAVALGRQDEAANAVVQCFYPGAQGGRALADVLFGRVSPCGRLPVTFYASTADLPPFENYDMENRTYRFFRGTPTYPFGHGLTYSPVTETWLDDETVTLTNVGGMETGYSVLRYADRPERRLIGFEKVRLGPGESVTVKVRER